MHRINFFLKSGRSTEHLKEEYRTPLTIKKGKTWEKERKDFIMAKNDLFSQRELEVIQHALKQLYEDVSVMNDHQSDAEFSDYLHEIKTIQDRISDTMQHEILN